MMTVATLCVSDFFPRKFMKIIIVILILLAASTMTFAQSKYDVCQVYVVDVAAARKAFDNFHERDDAEAYARTSSVGQTLFPPFRTTFQEEELTTKHYRFPHSKL